MTRPPFDRRDAGDRNEADPVARELEAYAGLTAGEQPHGLADRVMAAVADEPTPRRGILAGLLATLESGRGGGMTRMVLVGATMALAVLAVVAFGQLANLFPDQQIGPSPLPSVPSVPESVAPSVTETPTPSPSPSERPSRTPRPSPSDDDSPEASGSPDDDESESPEPSDDDNSGPGGGGDDDGGNSGPGGGGSGSDDDSSGRGSGDGSG